MTLEFLKDYYNGILALKKGDILSLCGNDSIEELNENYYMLLHKGLRYDIKKDVIKIIK